MSLQAKPDAAKLRLAYGATALQGSTEQEQQALRVGYILTVILTGEQFCSSLSETAQNGGC